MTEHPITPPPELVHQWHKEACKDPYNWGAFIATQAARWGADQELGACCEWVRPWRCEDKLRDARRPKPPSLKEQALEALEHIDGYAIQQMSAYAIHDKLKNDADTIRRALEALPE